METSNTSIDKIFSSNWHEDNSLTLDIDSIKKEIEKKKWWMIKMFSQ